MIKNSIKIFEEKYPDRKVTLAGRLGTTVGVMAPLKKHINADVNNIPLDNPFYKISLSGQITKGDPFVDDALLGKMEPV